MAVAVEFSVRPLLPQRGRLPLLVEASDAQTDLLAVFDELKALVDEHLLRTVGNLTAIEKGELAPELPLTTEIFKSIQNSL